jgi:hypothetical protein
LLVKATDGIIGTHSTPRSAARTPTSSARPASGHRARRVLPAAPAPRLAARRAVAARQRLMPLMAVTFPAWPVASQRPSPRPRAGPGTSATLLPRRHGGPVRYGRGIQADAIKIAVMFGVTPAPTPFGRRRARRDPARHECRHAARQRLCQAAGTGGRDSQHGPARRPVSAASGISCVN